MMQLVWFKRDLRTVDHAALQAACQAGPVLAIYVVEPELWQQPDASRRHWYQIAGALHDLREDLAELGLDLLLQRGEITDVLASIQRRCGRFVLHAHEETGNDWSFRRDRLVRAWCRERGLDFVEQRQFGVFRGLRSRDGWSARWHDQMRAPIAALPRAIRAADWPGQWPAVEAVAPVLPDDGLLEPQPGGRRAGLATLESFLNERGKSYHRGISSPLTAEQAGSRLSPYISFGCLSLREIVKATEVRRRALREQGDRTGWQRALSAFSQRLRWHCHFIQKLESQPRLEFENMARFYDGMREDHFDSLRYQAWCRGETGFPLVDACMRSLTVTGWLNFRMRAMLMAFAAYHLWLHWREPALHLARMFSDYEPGIHYCQVQMQSGVTGINTVRVYNPVKQSMDQDPDGEFIRRWLPELAVVPGDWIHQPWLMSAAQQQKAGLCIGKHYPSPVVEHLAAAKAAREAVWARRQSPEAQRESRQVQQQLGSRRKHVSRQKKRTESVPVQRSLF